MDVILKKKNPTQKPWYVCVCFECAKNFKI